MSSSAGGTAPVSAARITSLVQSRSARRISATLGVNNALDVDAQKLGTCRIPHSVIAVAPPSGSRLLPITGNDAAAVAIANR